MCNKNCVLELSVNSFVLTPLLIKEKGFIICLHKNLHFVISFVSVPLVVADNKYKLTQLLWFISDTDATIIKRRDVPQKLTSIQFFSR